MVSVKLKFRSSTVAGKEGTLYYQVICNRTIRQIATSYRIKPSEWNTNAEDLIIGPKSERTSYLESIKLAIQNDISRLGNIVNKFAISEESFSADIIVAEFKRQHSNITLFEYMERIIARYWNQGQYRTSETYLATLNSFRRFRQGIDIDMGDITSELVESYEYYLKYSSLSPNTISFYIKHLRAVYNRAVEDDLIVDRKPFKRVSISTEKTTKRALSLKVIKRLKALDCSHRPSKRFAKDMFLFSFYTRGHGFSVLSDEAIFQYKCDNLYAPESEGAIAWNDPDIGIDWQLPAEDVLLSAKDVAHPMLKDAEDLFDYNVDYYAE